MLLAATYLPLIAERAEYLALLLLPAFGIGELLARGPFTRALAALRRAVATLGRKLDRDTRPVAVRVYRGLIAVAMLLLPMLAATVFLGRVPPLVALLLLAWFGQCFATISNLRLWRAAPGEALRLEQAGERALFADSHALLRHYIGTRTEAFAVGVVGGGFWYVLGGLPAMGVYLALAGAHHAYRARPAFGWAARGAFALADFLPRLLARGLVFLAGFFTPQTRPFAGLRAKDWQTAVARTLDITLGGPSLAGAQEPWVGEGTARLTGLHARRAVRLLAVAALLLGLLLAGRQMNYILINIV
ncbi:MAG: hypothetical protein SFW64_07550 [Alphaproteobacteria bacterium]|nr:hypothetical protein [Alphaproteobacteria bacterium]